MWMQQAGCCMTPHSDMDHWHSCLSLRHNSHPPSPLCNCQCKTSQLSIWQISSFVMAFSLYIPDIFIRKAFWLPQKAFSHFAVTGTWRPFVYKYPSLTHTYPPYSEWNCQCHRRNQLVTWSHCLIC